MSRREGQSWLAARLEARCRRKYPLEFAAFDAEAERRGVPLEVVVQEDVKRMWAILRNRDPLERRGR